MYLIFFQDIKSEVFSDEDQSNTDNKIFITPHMETSSDIVPKVSMHISEFSLFKNG